MGRLIDPGRRERARSERAERREILLATAAAVFAGRPPSEASLDEVSRRAQVPESTARVLFASVDELFLEVLDRELRLWSDVLQHRLEGCRAGGGRAAAMCEVVAGFADRPVLLRLLGHLPAVLERSIDVSAALGFLHRQHERVQRLGLQLEDLVQSLAEGEGAAFVWRLIRAAGGLAPYCRPTGAMAVALVDFDLTSLRVEIADELGFLADRLLPD